jgi:hypothetical protein
LLALVTLVAKALLEHKRIPADAHTAPDAKGEAK